MTLKVILISALLMLTSCSAAGTTTASPTTEPASVPLTTDGATHTTLAASTTTAQERSAFETALDATTEAGSYEFGGQLVAYVGSATATTALHGWVDGTNQLIVTESQSGLVETSVTDGIATVTKDGTASTVDLGAVEAAPSFQLLEAIEIQEETTGMVKGLIPASLVSGDTASGMLNVTVWYSSVITAYEISESTGAWELSMTFSDVGTFDSTATS